MKVSNIRLGFATNSSSVHSIVNPAGLVDDYYDQEFGWDEFTLVSERAKSKYLAQTLYHNLIGQIGEELAGYVAGTLLGCKVDPEGYIDHQSMMTLPLSPKTSVTSLQFFEELKNRYLQPDIAIVGGNDNSEFSKYPEKMRRKHLIPDDASSAFCRKDGDWWTLMSPRSGTKIRLSFNDSAKPYVKASSPELVDLKITDMCLMNCQYCYQSSNEYGAHAKYDDLMKLVWMLSEMGVFEVVLGGGEPTRHPRFTDIVNYLRYYGIPLNFSTRDLHWTTDSSIVETVREKVARFGVSVCYSSDVDNARKRIPECLHDKIYWHYVLNTGDLEGILKVVSEPVVLLGYKKVGRGAKYLDVRKEDWIKTIKGHWGAIAIDTALANEYRNKVGKEFNPLLVQYDEGKFSMYIDAVNMTAGRSSYCGDYIPIAGMKSGQVLNLFREW